MWRKLNPRRQFIASLFIAIVVCAGLLAFGSIDKGSEAFTYLLWNVLLAVLPLVFALRLAYVLRKKRWSAWGPIGWSLLWLLFLPNSFYMISDYIHLREVSRGDMLYNAVMFTSFIYLGVLVGFCSLYVVHNQLRRRLRALPAALWIAATLFVCSCAIYIGRDLRWNSWDVLFNPAGLLFDISDRLLRPDAYPDMIVVIVSFFVLLGSLYGVFYSGAKLLRHANHHGH